MSLNAKPYFERQMSWHDGVSIIVPTFRRHKGLKTALESLIAQTAGGRPIEIVVSDNDPDGSAKAYVTSFAAQCDMPVIYVHASIPGVANARNMALGKARGRYLAFLDDDQFVAENWLSSLLDIMEETEAGLAFCPTYAQSELAPRYTDQCLNFFSRDIDQKEDGLVEDFFGCGNSLLDKTKCALPNPSFHPGANETGGEDDLLFSQLQAQGTKIAWTRQTHAKENVENWRMNHKYIRVRSFAYGQGPSRICADPENFNMLGLMRWTVIGTAQFILFAPIAAFYRLIGHEKYIIYMRKMAEGAGKVFWYEKFRPKIYGATALKAQLERECQDQKEEGKKKRAKIKAS